MSKNLEKTYNPKEIEAKLYEKWCEEKYFHAEVDRSKKPFTTVMPPTNITGKLHMGHALDNTLQDILIRYKRMEGYNALWIPGTDHAAISTEVKVTDQDILQCVVKRMTHMKFSGNVRRRHHRCKRFSATGTESVLRWMRDARKRLKKYLSNYMKKDIFTKDQGSSTGVRNVRHLFQMQR